MMRGLAEIWEAQPRAAGPFNKGVRILAWTLLAADILLVAFDLVFTQWQVIPAQFVKDVFDLGAEGNIPTWFASIQWFLISLAALACYWAEPLRSGKLPGRNMWLVIGLVFLLASVDDAAQIHENVGSALAEFTLHSSFRFVLAAGSENSPWILFYAPLLVLFLCACIWFLWRRFGRFNRLKLLLVAAVECYAAAVAFDYFQGLPASRQFELANLLDLNREPFVNATIVVEETLENIGTSLLVIALAAHANNLLAPPGTGDRSSEN